jgi:NAD(P)-dependent dehydrogenase (short-subunit alcohol dehydrogenase family)
LTDQGCFHVQALPPLDVEVRTLRTDNLLDFSDQVVLITGGATGIGRATALAFARQGANVVVGDIDNRAEETIDLVKEVGARGLFVPTDVTQAGETGALVRAAVEEFGGLHVAFNNAGILPPTGPLLEQTEEDWDKTIAVDLKGVFLALRAELAHMVAAGAGSIINTASVAGVVADPGMAPYAAAKHGVVGLTRAAALDYATSGVRVNAVAPGLVETPMTRAWLADPAMRETVLASSPMRRAAEPEEIAGIVLYLASPLASFANGGVFTVDAGQTAH